MKDVVELRQQVIQHIDSIAADLVELSHDIHAHPELNFEEHHASEALCKMSSRLGVELERGAYSVPTAVAGEVGTGPRVGILCEYDALPGIGHGCGHNVIAAAGLGAGIALARIAAQAGGCVRILGTPAEEGGGGKVFMARAGAFDDLSAAMMVHPADENLAEISAIAVQQLFVHYQGLESHAAAAPQKGRNALDAAVLGYMGVAALRQHIRPTERVHGIFTKAGDKPNIVPREAAMHWYIRSDDTETLRPLKARVLAALEGGATACGCTMTHTWDQTPYADMVTNRPLIDSYSRFSSSIGREVHEASADHAVVGSTDMGNVSHLVPSIHPMIAIAPRGTAIHTAEFAAYAISQEADRAIIDGAKAMALTALDMWTNSALRQQINDDHQTANPDRDVL
jgi:amidohydrolase